MEHLPGLIADLALILITGAITTLLFRKIKQPLVLGYIIAGFLVGPHLGITRNHHKILNPPSDFVFATGDIVWIAGDRKKIQEFQGT